MKIGSLFAGIGGLELGLEQAGVGEVEWQVEIDGWCRAVLARRWPNANRSIVDVREAGRATLPFVDLICGGFPCQDVSSAGLGEGLEGARSGLWYEYRRVVDELRPTFVVVENVASGKGRWLCEVLGDLQALGYRTRALGVAARDLGAPHRRARVFVLGVADTYRGELRERAERVPGRRARGVRGEGRAEPVDPRDEGLADADAAGRSRLGSGVALDGEREACGYDVDRCGGEGRAEVERREDAQPQVGGGPDGVPAGVVRRGEERRGVDAVALRGGAGGVVREPPAPGGCWRWPAGRGAEQHDWEPPRAVPYAEGTSRPEQLAALGNAVMPPAARLVGHVLLDWIGATGDDARGEAL